ncbi:MAG: ACT domain-containing protein [Candidatus Peribacteraceae bacterium]
MKIVSQLSIGIPNSPGSLAHMTDMLRAADVNIDALFCTEGPQTTTVHLVTDDPETAKMVLGKIGPVSASDVIAFEMPNKPGSIAQVARKCAGAGINIRHIYATSTGKGATLYLSAEQVESAMNALK